VVEPSRSVERPEPGLRGLELDLHEHIHGESNVLFPRALPAA
jgi:iron-sulfur cluster repair protein YtfE (RIC family)